jgi:hypothetical protein
MTEHRHAQELAATGLTFDLDPAEARDLAAHLASCAGCRRFAADLHADAEALARLPQRDAPARVAATVQAGRRGHRGSGRSTLLLAAALGLLALASLGTLAVGARLAIERGAPSPAVAVVVPVPSARPPSVTSESPPPSAAAVSPLAWQRVADQPDFHAPHGVMEAIAAGGPGLVAVGDGCAKGDKRCHAAVWTSVDGATWTRVPDSAIFDVGPYVASRRGEMTDVIKGGPGLIAVGRELLANQRRTVIWTSPDGLSWTRVADSPTFERGTIEAITAGGPGYVAVGSEIVGTLAVAAVWTSVDGVAWQRTPEGSGFDLGGPGHFNDGRVHAAMTDVVAGPPGLVAVGSACAPTGGSCRAAVWTSPDGIAWARVADDPVFDGSMYGVASWAGGLVAVGGDATGKGVRAWTSSDGTTWTAAAHLDGVDGTYTAVVSLGDRLVASAVDVGLRTTIVESRDGLDWTLAAPTMELGTGAINGLGR